MKKWSLILLAGLLSLTGCGRNEVDPELVITCDPKEETVFLITQPQETEDSQELSRKDYIFVAGNVELVPGAAFDPAALPEAESVYGVPSCAVEGTDNLYNYGTFELTAINDGTGEVIYSILLLDPNVTTPEGLALGDDAAKVTSLYGSGYTQEGTARVYMGRCGMLCIILQGQTVASIEYRMNIE